jgi:ElaB/YqjD/DUF883 family membrane-anchored ribosome-binding protein
MESNQSDGFNTPDANTQRGSGAYGASGSGTSSDTSSGTAIGSQGGSQSGSSAEMQSGSQQLADTATREGTGGMQQRGEMGGDRLGQLKERATDLKVTLADKLEAGADRLRQRSQSGNLAGAGAAGGVQTIAGDERVTQMADSLAGGLQRSAQWLREGELNDVKSAIEQQVKSRPARTLLIAVGVGYVLGKALRR